MSAPGFGPMNVPGLPFPDPDEGKRWYRRWFMWVLAGAVAVGAILTQVLR